MRRYWCITVRNANGERRSGCPVGCINSAAAGPGNVVRCKITWRKHVVIAQFPLAAIAAVVTASYRVHRILEPVAFNQCITRLTHVNTGTGNAVIQVVIHVSPTAALQWQTRIYVAINIVVEGDLAAAGNIAAA